MINKRLPNGRNAFYVIYTATFLLSAHAALVTFINSTFLTETIQKSGFLEILSSETEAERLVGILYTIGSILTIFALIYAPLILRRFGNYRTLLTLLFVEAFAMLGMAAFQSVLYIIPLFIIHSAIISIIYFNLDIFLESYSDDSSTGSIRGVFLTTGNLAWIFPPLVAGFILTNGDFWKVYLTAAAFIIPILFLLTSNLKNFSDPHYGKVPFWKTLKLITQRKDIYRVSMISLFLNIFYSWMVIYTPIYLHEHLGMLWSDIGIILTIAMLPFVIFQLPAGRIADSKLGEKELLTIGFILLALSSTALAFITSTSVVIWAAALFATRIGAAIVEVMSETYFFKQIDGTDAHLVGFFRKTRPLAYIVSPILATVLLHFIDTRFLFVALGIIMLFALRYTLTIHDTK